MTNMTNSSSGPVQEQFQPNGPLWIFLVSFILGMVTNCFIIFVIKRTPALQSYSGTLMINQTLCDVFLNLVSVSTVVSYLISTTDLFGRDVYILLVQIRQTLQGISSQTSAAISLNLYFAICHSTAYRNRMSKRYVYSFIPICWILNLLTCMVPLIPEETRTSLYVCHRVFFLQNYVTSTYWAWIIIIANAFVIPAVITAFSFVMIYKHSQKIQPSTDASLHRRDKYKLSQVITGIYVCYIGIWILLHVFRSLQAKYELQSKESSIFQKIALIAYTIKLIYDQLKLIMYLWIYKPMRETVVQMIRRLRPTRVEMGSELNQIGRHILNSN